VPLAPWEVVCVDRSHSQGCQKRKPEAEFQSTHLFQILTVPIFSANCQSVILSPCVDVTTGFFSDRVAQYQLSSAVTILRDHVHGW
jgi:hypothetical protein